MKLAKTPRGKDRQGRHWGHGAIEGNSALLVSGSQWAKLARFRGGDKLFAPRGSAFGADCLNEVVGTPGRSSSGIHGAGRAVVILGALDFSLVAEATSPSRRCDELAWDCTGSVQKSKCAVASIAFKELKFETESFPWP